jgi:hypothetical protein
MKYRVTFRERSNERGERAEDPTQFLEPELDDSMVLDAAFVSRAEPPALHSSDREEEDDAFMSLSEEVWEYDVAEGRDEDFKNALLNSGVVMEFEPLEDNNELGIT